MPTRPKAVKPAPEPEQPTGPTEAEVQLATAQENQAYMASQLQYLQGRVAGLRIELNRALSRVAELESTENAQEG